MRHDRDTGNTLTLADAPTAREADDYLTHWAAKTPHALAIDAADGVLTYRELEENVDRVARHLRLLGVGPGTLVGLGLPRGSGLLVALFGVLRAGGAYLPLDPEYPRDRIALLLEDAKPRLVLTGNEADAYEGHGAPTLLLDSLLSAPPAREPAVITRPRPSDLAYVIYTSGSTGKPKGVCIDRESLAHRFGELVRLYPLGPGDRVLQYASLNFDASLYEVGLGLCHGATLCITTPKLVPPGAALQRFLEEKEITFAWMPPSVLATLPGGPLPQLRFVSVGGETCHARLVEQWGAGRRFINCYGPTETTIWATQGECTPGEEPTIGRPLGGVTAHVLDADLKPVPPGEPGELWLGGAGVAQGYLNRPDLTAERFIPDPFRPGGRLYRTGDHARWLPDGRIQFLGRLDRQVKVRGVRIELDEVEAALAHHPGVRDVAVIADKDPSGATRLVAYVVPVNPQAPAPLPREAPEAIRRDLRAFLATRVVDAMVPALYVLMPGLPLTPNGKADRKALPPVATVPAAASHGPLVGASSPVERILAEAWAEALGVQAVSVHDNLFDLGAHSLLVAKVQERVSRLLGRDVPALAFFEYPTIAALARHLQPPPTA
ncbi:MAG TPA: non-ribosomal peptide synthetase, partial [Candidatus Thermoplasmatota archaeon]|nr:non-ribosomal peptide synthetase [Candidatus Thermoplasmatota archaeon]